MPRSSGQLGRRDAGRDADDLQALAARPARPAAGPSGPRSSPYPSPRPSPTRPAPPRPGPPGASRIGLAHGCPPATFRNREATRSARMPGEIRRDPTDGGRIGATRFELVTSCSQGRRANQAALRPATRVPGMVSAADSRGQVRVQRCDPGPTPPVPTASSSEAGPCSSGGNGAHEAVTERARAVPGGM